MKKTIHSKKTVKNIYKELSALVWKEDDWYVALCVEVEVASQGETRQKALTNLKEAIELHFEDEPSFSKLIPYKNVSVEKVKIAPYA